MLDNLPLQVRDKLSRLSYAEQQLQQQYARLVPDKIQSTDNYYSPMDCDINLNLKEPPINVASTPSAIRPMRYFR